MIFSNFIKKLSYSFLAILLLPIVTFAQGGEEEGLSLAQINVGDATMNVTTDNINVVFNIANTGTVPQSDIKYGTELLKTSADGAQVIADRLVSEETVSVAAGDTLFRTANHPLAGVAPGQYSVWVVARTTGGIMLGLTNAGTVTVTNSTAVSFLAETCTVTIGDEETNYIIDQGVDVDANEDLYLNCKVKNYTNEELSVAPIFDTHRRTAFGDRVEVDYGVSEVIKFAAGEEKSVSILLPKASEPQAYDITLALASVKSKEVLSSHIGVHYVLRGASATIQTVNFDKAKYATGENIGLTLFWSGPADGFADSRSGAPTELSGEVVAKIAVNGGNGVACIDPVTQVVKPGEVKVSAVAKADCIDPTATLSLVDASGLTLDSRSIEIKTPVEEPAQNAADDIGVNKSPLLLFAFVALALVAIVILIMFARRRKVNIVDTTKLMVLGVVALSGLFGGAADAEAVTWTHYWSNSGGNWQMGVTLNTNKTTYAPGETINLSSAVWNISCTNNVVAVHRLTATLGAQSRVMSDTNVNSPTTVYGSGTLTAPTTPGTYTIRATILTKARGETSYRDITINVVAPAVAAVGNFDSVDASTCSVAGWAYDADSPASSINVSIYRDGPYGSGTHVAHCAANQARPDVNAAYGITGNHGFNCVLPASYRGTGSHNLYIHAIDISNTPNNVISGSPKALSCAAASATISGSGCTIPEGSSTCPGSVTWSITGATTPNVYNFTGSNSFSSAASGSNQPITLTYGDTTLQARDGSSVLASTIISGVGCAAGSSWVAGSCQDSSASGNISGNGCDITEGNSTCQGSLTWDIDGSSNPRVTDQGGSVISTNANGNNSPVTLNYGTTDFMARDGSSLLDTVGLTADCATGLLWYSGGNECVVTLPSSPAIDLTLDRELVRSGNTVELTTEVTANYPTECTIVGLTDTPITFSHSGTPASATYTNTSKPLNSAQVIEVTCEPDPAVAGIAGATATTRADVIPVLEEI